MTEKIFRSIVAVALSVLFAGIIIATSFLYNYFSSFQAGRLKSEISLVADLVNVYGSEYLEKLKDEPYRVTLISNDGTVIYDTQAVASEMTNHADRKEVAEAFMTGRGSSQRVSETLTSKTFYETLLLDDGNVLRISVSRSSIGGLLLGMLPAILAILFCAVAVSFFLSHGMSKRITAPLMDIDFDKIEDKEYYDELAPIFAKINSQHKQISSQMEELKRRSDEFEQLISSMSEGLVMLDEHGMVLSINKAARAIFDVKKDDTCKDFLLLDGSKKISKGFWDAVGGKRSEYKEERQGSEYQFNISPIKTDGKVIGVIILAFDITEKAYAERNRQEFTANVSHELKTPLQSIIGSAELLENGLVKPEDNARFVGNIRKEAVRLVSLIDDIIRLSRLDENQEIIKETVNLEEVAKEVIEGLSASAEKRGISMEFDGESLAVLGVRRYIYEIVYNLCDNAIRYNIEGGSVKINVKKKKNRTLLSVSDTGIGIAPEHRARVFERFYRVDKSHSRQSGGTGLGLAIVKHGAAYHNAEIVLESEVGKGTKITVSFA